MEPLIKTDVQKELRVLQTNQKIELVIADDMDKLYGEALRARIKELGLQVSLTTSQNEGNSGSGNVCRMLFEGELVDLPLFEDVSPNQPEAEEQQQYKNCQTIKGLFIDVLASIPRLPQGYRTKLEDRYEDLKAKIFTIEQNPTAIKLLDIQNEIRLLLKKTRYHHDEIADFAEKICRIDHYYYDILAVFIKEAIDSVMQLVTLGDVMKRYIKVLLIDDLGNRSLEELEKRGFRKRFLTSMSSIDLKQGYYQFSQQKKDSNQKGELSFNDYLAECSLFTPYEIIVYNPWKSEDGGINIQFRLKKSPDLSHKEIRELNTPEKKEIKINNLKHQKEETEHNLKAIESELKFAENEGHLPEHAYVLLNKKRKRYLADLQKVSDKLKSELKPTSSRPTYEFYQKNLTRSKEHKLGLLDILKKRSDQSDVYATLARLAFLKKQTEKTNRLLNRHIKKMITEMDTLANSNPLHPDQIYQQTLGIHALNRIEIAMIIHCVLRGSSQIHWFEKPYLLPHRSAPLISWGEDKVKQLNIRVASRTFSFEKELLSWFFRINDTTKGKRLLVDPSLPKTGDFDNRSFDVLFILTDSYGTSSVFECVQMRNEVRDTSIPIFLVDTKSTYIAKEYKTRMDLLMGIQRKESSDDELVVTPYHLTSFDNSDILVSTLCQGLGIARNSVPVFEPQMESIHSSTSSTAAEDAYPNHQEELISKETKPKYQPDTKPEKDVRPESPPEQAVEEDSVIEIIEEEIYTLNSIFSFDDAQLSNESSNSGTNDPSQKSGDMEKKGDFLKDSDKPSEATELEKDDSGKEDTDYNSSHLF